MNTSANIQHRTSPLKKSPIVEKSLNLYLRTNYRKENLAWGVINAVLMSILVYDILNKCPFAFSQWYYVEYIITGILAISTVYNFCKYLYYLFALEPVEGNAEQRDLLSFSEQDSRCIVTTKKLVQDGKHDLNTTPLNQTLISWNSSPNVSILSMSWFRNTSPPTSPNCSLRSNLSFNSSNNTQNARSPNTSFLTTNRSSSNMIIDEAKLQQYLRQCAEMEENINQTYDSNHTRSGNSMSNYWNCFKMDDVTGLLKTAVYQLSPTIVSKNNQNAKDEGSFMNFKDVGNSELLGKLTLAQLSKYVANLRMWMSQTILKPLVVEINKCDESLKSRGVVDIQIGSVGLERLKKTAENQQLISGPVPMLPLIIPFLEMSSNQEYLVQRIKELAKGSCIGEYRWNSGSSYNGLNWDEHLPTDSAILFHLFCTYIDGQLNPMPPPGGRPFYNRYILCSDKSSKEAISEIKNKSNCAILCTNTTKTQFNFICDGKIHPFIHDRNNLFNVIIQFLIFMKTNCEGILERVSFGPSGINILCVIDE